jgi:integrase
VKHPDYPGVSSFTDVRGGERWRFRKTGMKTVYLPGEPHSPSFDDAYRAATEGRIQPKPKAEIIAMPGAAHPASLSAAWRKVQQTAKWKALDPESKALYVRYAEEFLGQPAGPMKIGDGPCEAFRPRHVAAALDAWSDTPHKARILFVVLQKMMRAAVREEWIEYDPTASVDRPDVKTRGKEAWPPHICAKFEQRWPIGTQPRTAYELAKWLGTRRSDVASVRWDQMVTELVAGEAVEGFKFVQYKGRNRDGAFAKFHPMTPMLAEALAPLDRSTETVLAQPNGRPYKIKSMTAMMWHWRRAAGIPKGYSLHGLRHAAGAMLADAGATPLQIRDVLGHATISEQDKYTKQREQARQAVGGSKAIVRLVRG